MDRSDILGIGKTLEEIRASSPVIHNITNFVVMNTTANALLAIGASPVMAHAEEEMADMVSIASALVINIGTLSAPWVRSMFMAADQAAKRAIPVILDPVGAGATAYRTKTAREMIDVIRPAVIRGNASEIMAVAGDSKKTKGVDSADASHDAVSAAAALHRACGAVVCISGQTDYVVGKDSVVKVKNGHPMMTRVTGLGCTATALCGAFAAVNNDYARATAQAMAVMGIAGQKAAAGAAGPGSLQVRFLDALYTLSGLDIAQLLDVEL